MLIGLIWLLATTSLVIVFFLFQRATQKKTREDLRLNGWTVIDKYIPNEYEYEEDN